MQTQDYRVDPQTGCWVWQGGTRNGYGRCRRNGKTVTAHIWYWEQEHGPVPSGFDLDHVCHNRDESCPGGFDCPHRRCVNPAHLELASRVQNVRRGRRAKLTEAQVAEIRASDLSRAELMERYNVSNPTISKIRSGETWRGVGSPTKRRKVLGRPKNTGARLTDEQIAEIRATPRRFGSGRALAHKYGVSDARISALRR